MIGEQHLVSALKWVKEDCERQQLEVPNQYNWVLAKILKADTPVPVCQLAAGDEQAATAAAAVKELSVVKFGRLFLSGATTMP